MTQRNIILIDRTGKVAPAQLEKVAQALTTQISRDFASVWDVAANVVSTPSPNVTYWPINILDTIDVEGVYGYHYLQDGLPYANVLYRPDWTITASHELIEMLVNPFLNNYKATDITPRFKGDESFLLEVAGPVQDISFGYYVNDVLVSNFIYPAYFDLVAVSGKKYDHLGVITAPKTIALNGYVSFINSIGQWWQSFNIQNTITIRKLSEGNTSDTAHVDRVTRIVFWSLFAVCTYFILKIFIKNDNQSK